MFRGIQVASAVRGARHTIAAVDCVCCGCGATIAAGEPVVIGVHKTTKRDRSTTWHPACAKLALPSGLEKSISASTTIGATMLRVVGAHHCHC